MAKSRRGHTTVQYRSIRWGENGLARMARRARDGESA